jgi:hypothetical protein
MSSSIMLSESELSLSESVPIMLTLPSDPDTMRSGAGIVDHKLLGLLLSDSGAPYKLNPFFRFGIAMPLPDRVGEESGDDCSASVE